MVAGGGVAGPAAGEVVDERPEPLLADRLGGPSAAAIDRLLPILDRLVAWLEARSQSVPPRRLQAIEAECDALRAAFHQRVGEPQRAFDEALRAWERLPRQRRTRAARQAARWGWSRRCWGSVT